METVVGLTDREIKALQNITKMYRVNEYQHCDQWIDNNNLGNIVPQDLEDGDHIWYDLRVIDRLLDKINTKNIKE